MRLAFLEVPQGHLGDDQDVFTLVGGLLQELGQGAVEHVDDDVGDRPEPPAQDQDRAFVEDFGRLDDLAVGHEHGRVGEAAVHQLQDHQAIVHLGESRPGKVDQVDLDPLVGQVVQELPRPGPPGRRHRARRGSG